MPNRFVGFHVYGRAEADELKRLMGDGAAVVEREGCVSVYDGALPLAETEQKACALSMRTGAPVLFAAASEGTFLLGRCIMGFTVLRHCIGDCSADGVRETHAKSRDLCDQLHLDAQTDAIRRLVRERRIDLVIPEMEKLIGVPFAND